MAYRSTITFSRIMQVVIASILVLTVFRMPQSLVKAQTQPWMDTSLPAGQRARLLLTAMTLDEKLAMVYGNNAGSAGYVGHVPAIPRLGIPELNLQDGPAGVAGGMIQVTAFPAPLTVAASWDTALMEKYGVAMAEEERAKGANVQLGPMMNIDRVPEAGRNFEGFGEDPYLSAQMAAASVRGIQSTGVIATAKHYIDNDQEYQRNTISSEIDTRTQHEIYLPPFKAAVEAGVGAIMCSYNRINGIYACENPDTQNTLLKGELGFRGWIMSDWGATHSLAASALGGLDMEMPTGINFLQLKAAIESGQVPESQLDDMVLRILTSMFQAGLFEHGSTGMIGVDAQTPAHQEFARSAAAQGMVLLKNEAGILPVDPAKVHTIALFGSAADAQPIIAGGGSGHVSPPYVISPLQGIQKRAGSAIQVSSFNPASARGNPIADSIFGPTGLKAQFFNTPDLTGNPVLTKNDKTIDFSWQTGAPAAGVNDSNWSARWSGSITPTISGKYNLALTSTGGSRLYIDDNLVIDNWGEHPEKTKLVVRRFTGGQKHTIKVEYQQAGSAGAVRLTWLTPDDDPNQEAAALAAQSDLAIVIVGANSGEGGDRQNLDVSDEALLIAVAKANPHVIAVVYNPAQVSLPWIDQVQAVLLGWIPGQEAGHALADVLFGEVNPAGKLPITFALDAGDYPANTAQMYPGVNGQVLYSEGLEVGYRHFDSRNIQPLFPFGHGLSYTTFNFDNLVISPATITTDSTVTVGVDVTNTGQRAGAEVAQLYAGFPSETSEPPLQLKGFQKVFLQPGETKHLTFTLSQTDYSFWSAGLEAWIAYPGSYKVMLGSSSRDIRQSGTFVVQGGLLAGAISQAEAATLTGDAAKATDQTGYTGDGFVRGFQKTGSAIAFKVDASESGQYQITLRYSSTLRPGEQNTPRSLSLYVNGNKTGQTSLPNLANWNMWDFKTETVTLTAGENSVAFQKDSGDNGDVQLDSITVTRVVEPTPIPSVTSRAAGETTRTITPASNPLASPSLLIPVLASLLIVAALVVIMARRRRE